MIRHGLETKSLTVSETGEITGIAWGAGPDSAGDVIHRGGFGSVTGPVVMLWQHRAEEPIGIWDTVRETDAGLEVKGRLQIEHSPRAREAHAYLRDGVVRGLSIGFRLERKAAPRGFGAGRDIRADHGLKLHEISIVTRPSHPGANVISTKSAAEAVAIVAALERLRASLRT